MYAGKPVAEDKNDPNNPYVKGIFANVKRLLIGMSKYQELKGRHLTFDRLYTCAPLVDWLYNHMKMTSLGTLKANRKGLPVDFKNVKRDPGDYMVLYEVDGNKSIHSWIATSKTGTGKYA